MGGRPLRSPVPGGQSHEPGTRDQCLVASDPTAAAGQQGQSPFRHQPSRNSQVPELTRQIVDSHPDLRGRIVLISTRHEEDFADLITASPATGFLSKAQLSARAVRDLVAGGKG